MSLVLFRRARRTRAARFAFAFGALGLALLGAQTAPRALAAPPSPNLSDYVASKLDDFSAIMHVTQHDDNAGRKINKDFGLIYKLKGDVTLQYKEENKLRLDGHIGPSKATLVVNGPTQYVRLAGLGIKNKSDLGASPGKRKTLLDAGLISSGYLAYTQGQFMGARPLDGVLCVVFRISYRDKSLDTSFRNVWIDPKTKVTVKREEYSQDGKLNCTYFYRDAKEVAPGIWFPSRIEVINNEGQKAGETVYRDVKVNTGLDDSLFRL